MLLLEKPRSGYGAEKRKWNQEWSDCRAACEMWIIWNGSGATQKWKCHTKEGNDVVALCCLIVEELE